MLVPRSETGIQDLSTSAEGENKVAIEKETVSLHLRTFSQRVQRTYQASIIHMARRPLRNARCRAVWRLEDLAVPGWAVEPGGRIKTTLGVLVVDREELTQNKVCTCMSPHEWVVWKTC